MPRVLRAVADGGRIELANGAIVQVRDVQSPITGLSVHRATIIAGEVTVGEQAQAEVDVERRRSISRAHTATHMVYKAIREALGDTATQVGSRTDPGGSAFDFNAQHAIPLGQLQEIEARPTPSCSMTSRSRPR